MVPGSGRPMPLAAETPHCRANGGIAQAEHLSQVSAGTAINDADLVVEVHMVRQGLAAVPRSGAKSRSKGVPLKTLR